MTRWAAALAPALLAVLMSAQTVSAGSCRPYGQPRLTPGYSSRADNYDGGSTHYWAGVHDEFSQEVFGVQGLLATRDPWVQPEGSNLQYAEFTAAWYMLAESFSTTTSFVQAGWYQPAYAGDHSYLWDEYYSPYQGMFSDRVFWQTSLVQNQSPTYKITHAQAHAFDVYISTSAFDNSVSAFNGNRAFDFAPFDIQAFTETLTASSEMGGGTNSKEYYWGAAKSLAWNASTWTAFTYATPVELQSVGGGPLLTVNSGQYSNPPQSWFGVKADDPLHGDYTSWDWACQ